MKLQRPTVFLAAVALLLAAPTARAADDAAARAKAHNAQATRAFNLGDFKTAGEQYKQAYAARPIPAFLYNMAQCHKRLATLHDLERAKFYFESYLANAPDASNNAEVEEEIADLKPQIAKLQAEQRAAAAAAAATAARKKEQDEPKTTPAAIAAAMRPATSPPQQKKPLYQKWWFWTFIGAAVVGGTVAAVAATSGGSAWTPSGDNGVFTPESFGSR